MTKQDAQKVLDKIVGTVFGYDNPFSVDDFMKKYAFDVRLPNQVTDTTTGEATWAQSVNPTKFITMDNAHNKIGDEGWERPKKALNSVEDILNAWQEVNYIATERHLESNNVTESDNIYNSENVYRSMDIHRSKNILLTDTVLDSEFIAASQRSKNSNFGIRLEDSQQCQNSFSVSWSGKVVNSFFIHDCYDMYESMFCSHITSRQYCIANMQFEKEEYMKLKDMVIKWILTSN